MMTTSRYRFCTVTLICAKVSSFSHCSFCTTKTNVNTVKTKKKFGLFDYTLRIAVLVFRIVDGRERWSQISIPLILLKIDLLPLMVLLSVWGIGSHSWFLDLLEFRLFRQVASQFFFILVGKMWEDRNKNIFILVNE